MAKSLILCQKSWEWVNVPTICTLRYRLSLREAEATFFRRTYCMKINEMTVNNDVMRLIDLVVLENDHDSW